MGIKVLFLDIDGVLLSTRSCVAQGGPVDPQHPTDPSKLDAVALGLVRKLCFETGAQVVICSSWRERHTRQELQEMLELDILDVTSTLTDHSRGHEVLAWLERHGNVEKYAIVDDHDDYLAPQQPHLVLTHFEDGLQWAHYKRLIHLL